MKYKNLYLIQIFLAIVIISFIFVSFPRIAGCQVDTFNAISDLYIFPSLSQGTSRSSMSDYYPISTLGQPISIPQAFSMSSMHNFPTLRKDEKENQWFHDWIGAFDPVAVERYPAVRVGTNQIDVSNIPHEWDVVTNGWDSYEKSLLRGDIKTQNPFKKFFGCPPGYSLVEQPMCFCTNYPCPCGTISYCCRNGNIFDCIEKSSSF